MELGAEMTVSGDGTSWQAFLSFQWPTSSNTSRKGGSDLLKTTFLKEGGGGHFLTENPKSCHHHSVGLASVLAAWLDPWLACDFVHVKGRGIFSPTLWEDCHFC